MSARMMLTTLALLLTLAGCSGDGDSGNGAGGAPQDSGTDAVDDTVDDTADDTAVGPWECLENNVAKKKLDGKETSCGFNRCTVEDGCGNTALGCENNDDCISSTLEIGWDTDLRVWCNGGACTPDSTFHDQ